MRIADIIIYAVYAAPPLSSRLRREKIHRRRRNLYFSLFSLISYLHSGQNQPKCSFKKSVGIIIKVTLNQNNRSALVSRSAGEVAQRTYKVGKSSGGCALGSHVANKVGALFLYTFGDSILSSSPERCPKSLSARYLILSSLGVPIRPSV